MDRRTRARIDSPRRAPSRSATEPGGIGLGPIRVTPVRVALALALIGSLAYVAFAITVRDASQIPMLSSGALVLGVVFTALAIAGALSSWRAGLDGRGRRALVDAVLGGVAAMIAAGCFAAAVVLALVIRS